MNLNKISNLIKSKRKELGITQEELANKLFVTEKAVSRWETGRGTPDISLLIPLAKELQIDVSELLSGETKEKNNIESVIEYNNQIRKEKHNKYFIFTIVSYVISILIFLFYLRFDYDPNIELNYFIRLTYIVISSIFIIIGNKIYSNYYVEKIEDKKKISTISKVIIFIYYVIMLINMSFLARYRTMTGVNLIPFKTINETLKSSSLYYLIINTLGNIFIFIPFEYFFIEFTKNKRLIINLLFIIIACMSIEIIQYVFKVGVLDIDDIILSTLGMFTFYILYTKKHLN